MFQGGFVGMNAQLLVTTDETTNFELVSHFFPDDSNSLQKFDIECPSLLQLKILFPESSDFYGRIIIYIVTIL